MDDTLNLNGFIYKKVCRSDQYYKKMDWKTEYQLIMEDINHKHGSLFFNDIKSLNTAINTIKEKHCIDACDNYGFKTGPVYPVRFNACVQTNFYELNDKK